MDKEPKLPPPLIDPHEVAKAILKASTEGGRDVKVGAMAMLNAAVSNLIPPLGDKMAAQRVNSQQETIHPLHPEGTLYKSGATGSSHGLADSG